MIDQNFASTEDSQRVLAGWSSCDCIIRRECFRDRGLAGLRTP